MKSLKAIFNWRSDRMEVQPAKPFSLIERREWGLLVRKRFGDRVINCSSLNCPYKKPLVIWGLVNIVMFISRTILNGGFDSFCSINVMYYQLGMPGNVWLDFKENCVVGTVSNILISPCGFFFREGNIHFFKIYLCCTSTIRVHLDGSIYTFTRTIT